jgi:hypothetical protein
MGEGKISFSAFSIYYRYRFGITSGSALLTNNTAGLIWITDAGRVDGRFIVHHGMETDRTI